MLHLAGAFGTEVASYRAIEYAGAAAESMSIASRMTMANMGVELGAKFAFFAADEVTRAYLAAQGQDEVPLFGPDADASYEADASRGRRGDRAADRLSAQSGQREAGFEARRRARAAGVSWAPARTGGSRISRWPRRILKGRRVHPETRLIVTPASQRVALEATRAGYAEMLLEAGAHITASGCGACPGGHNGVIGPGEVCLSSTNRNFRGRMGSPEARGLPGLAGQRGRRRRGRPHRRPARVLERLAGGRDVESLIRGRVLEVRRRRRHRRDGAVEHALACLGGAPQDGAARAAGVCRGREAGRPDRRRPQLGLRLEPRAGAREPEAPRRGRRAGRVVRPDLLPQLRRDRVSEPRLSGASTPPARRATRSSSSCAAGSCATCAAAPSCGARRTRRTCSRSSRPAGSSRC